MICWPSPARLSCNGFTDRVHIGLDYFDASINRVAAWTIGMRNMLRALLFALLEPTARLHAAEAAGDYTTRLVLLEEIKSCRSGRSGIFIVNPRVSPSVRPGWRK